MWAAGEEDIRVRLGAFDLTDEEWRSLRDRKLGPIVKQPDAFPPDAFESPSFGLESVWDDCQPWQVRWGNKSIRGGLWNTHKPGTSKPGTWICQEGKKPIRLLDGQICHQLVTPDGQSLVGTLADKLICFDLVKRKTIPIDDPETASNFYALDYLPVQKRVLLVRPWKSGPHELPPLPPGYGLLPATYRLLDPATGKTSVANNTGDVEHLRQPMHRPFQPSSQPGVIWVAFGKGNDFTELGRFDTKSLRFRKWIRIDSLGFDSDDVWVDEPSRKIYVVYRGHLLRLPLPKDVFDDWKF